ncbi:MAG: hypothetical protein JW929_07365 [Anaerolineales bacterium]|nr:hypothetical protein [Anaerolineales bacterium]
MDTRQLTKYIVDRLSAAANRDDVILYVCQRGRMDWNRAQALVADVEEAYAEVIDRRHLPINLTSSVMAVLAGALAAGYAVLAIFEPLIGRPLPDFLYLANDFAIHYGLLPDTRTALETLQRYDVLPDFWRTLYTLGQDIGVSRDLITAVFVLANGYFFWPVLVLGLYSLIAGLTEFFSHLFRLAGR